MVGRSHDNREYAGLWSVGDGGLSPKSVGSLPFNNALLDRSSL